MRAVFFLIILLSAYYIAAAFRFTPLLVMCMADGAALVLLFLSAWYLRWRVRASLAERTGEAVRGRERACTVQVRNASRLPAARLELCLTSRWMWEKRGETFLLSGGAERGEGRLTFHVRAAHCGLLLLRLDRVRVYDCLGLFHADRKGGEELCLAVYPAHVPLRVRLEGSEWDGVSHSTDRPGDESGEVLKIREYQAGDSIRRVHWNQSARTEKLWMKEFPREEDRRVHVLLDMGNIGNDGNSGKDGTGGDRENAGNHRDAGDRENAGNHGYTGNRGSGGNHRDAGKWDSPWAADAFWQALYSLSLGLLDTVAVIRFHWLDGEAARFFDAADVEQVRELFLLLFRAAFCAAEHGTGKKTDAASAAAPDPRLLDGIPPGDRVLRLTRNLCLYADGMEAARFSPKGLAGQIRAAALDL